MEEGKRLGKNKTNKQSKIKTSDAKENSCSQPNNQCPASPPARQPPPPGFIAEHDVILFGIPLRSAGVSYPSCVLPAPVKKFKSILNKTSTGRLKKK